MNASQVIIDANNKAIACLLLGQYDASASALWAALSSWNLCHEAEIAAKPNLNFSLADHPNISLALKLFDKVGSSVDSPIRSVPMSQECRTECDGTFSIFSHALTIFDNTKLLDGSVSKSYERIQAMLLYNLGLVLHCQAIRTGRSEALRGAQDLYEMSFSVVERSWQLFDLEDLMLLLMALFNNLGHIHSNLFNTQQTQTCIDWLQALAEHPAFFNLMQRDQYERFSMNLLVVLKQRQHCSPAA